MGGGHDGYRSVGVVADIEFAGFVWSGSLVVPGSWRRLIHDRSVLVRERAWGKDGRRVGGLG